VWVDDAGFDLDRHVQKRSVPAPGDDAALKALAAEFAATPLDRDRPLWEVWVAGGLAEGRFALLLKIHHAIANGASTVDLVLALLDPGPHGAREDPPPWAPRPAPGALALVADELGRYAAAPFALARALARGGARLGALAGTVRATLRPPAPSLLGALRGPARRFEWLALELGELRAAARRLDATVNDVLLAAAGGAVAQLLERRGAGLDGRDVRALVPVGLHAPGTPPRASVWLVSLGAGERDPQRRVALVRERTARLKATRAEGGVDWLLDTAGPAGSGLVALGTRLVSRLAPFDLLVTNVPGPQVPLNVLGAPLLAAYPLAPLFEHQGVAIAVASYLGRVFVGVNADPDAVPDVAAFVAALDESWRELARAAGAPG
jgi:WS/DGAT/MGAT family acyltransferase